MVIWVQGVNGSYHPPFPSLSLCLSLQWFGLCGLAGLTSTKTFDQNPLSIFWNNYYFLNSQVKNFTNVRCPAVPPPRPPPLPSSRQDFARSPESPNTLPYLHSGELSNRVNARISEFLLPATTITISGRRWGWSRSSCYYSLDQWLSEFDFRGFLRVDWSSSAGCWTDSQEEREIRSYF